MVEKFDVIVQIKDDLRKGLVFGLGARLPIAKVLGFTGYAHEVMPLMWNLSHGTRAYIVNADGEPGFIRSSFIHLLKTADEKGELKVAR